MIIAEALKSKESYQTLLEDCRESVPMSVPQHILGMIEDHFVNADYGVHDYGCHIDELMLRRQHPQLAKILPHELLRNNYALFLMGITREHDPSKVSGVTSDGTPIDHPAEFPAYLFYNTMMCHEHPAEGFLFEHYKAALVLYAYAAMQPDATKEELNEVRVECRDQASLFFKPVPQPLSPEKQAAPDKENAFLRTI